MDIPEGMREHQKFDHPIVTPTTKAEIGGHDQDISKEEIIARGLIPADIYEKVEQAALKLFERGTQIARQRGLILVDTKYEFGLLNGEVCLMDEIGFQGRQGDKLPEMTDSIVAGISDRYIELYEAVTGEKFSKYPYDNDIFERIEENVKNMLARL